jgi:signal transduction histidine kinase/CheY-like chemotaxis protein
VEGRAEAFARLFENIHEGAYVGTLHSGWSATAAANPQLKRTFGFARDAPEADVRPFDPDRFVDPQARGALLQRLGAGAVSDWPLRLRRNDGGIVWIELTARAEATEGGAFHIEAILRDVTARRRLDDETRETSARLAQAEKMAALGQTISGVAHELNNPLAAILSWAERLSKNTLADDSLRRGVTAILDESERATRIVRNLLTFARKRQTTRTMVDLNEVVHETVARRSDRPDGAPAIAVATDLAPGLPRLFADGYQLQQVLLNLVINAEQAIRSAHGRGTLLVRTAYDAARESVVLEVADDGPGIPDEVRAKIFDPFFTTKGVGAGTGLGLTVAYAIVQEHGGRIRVESDVGTGTSFFVEIPVAGAAAASPPEPYSAPSGAAPDVSGASILVVEDEAALAEAVTDLLGDAGFSVERVADGAEALERIGARRFDAVICDLKMPRVDGRMFYRALARRSPSLSRRVIFVTGDVAGTDAERFLNTSGCRWLAKPFRSADLLLAVRQCLSKDAP